MAFIKLTERLATGKVRTCYVRSVDDLGDGMIGFDTGSASCARRFDVSAESELIGNVCELAMLTGLDPRDDGFVAVEIVHAA